MLVDGAPSDGKSITQWHWQTRSRSAIRFDQLGHPGMGAAEQKKESLVTCKVKHHETPMTDVVRA
jgi:hypothetical protein